MPKAVFFSGTKIASEVDRSTAPSGAAAHTGAKAPWWGGGRWFNIITDGLPTLQDRQAIIFPAGHAGNRQLNQQTPVAGRKWSEGDIAAPVVGDFLGTLLYAALGGLSTNMVPSTAPSLLNNEPIAVNPKSFVLANQPDGGGNILRFDVKGQNAAFSISISGIDADGNGASEIISGTSTGLHYGRTSWSSIGASGIAISSLSAASVTIFGVRRWEHTFFSASSSPSFSIERVGVPTAGNTASKSHLHVGMVLRELALNTPADDNEGIFTVSSSWEGDPTATCNSASLNTASSLKIWPAWTLRITRDGGTNWYRPTVFNLTVGGGNRTYRAAAGAQSPQGKFEGPQDIRADVTILLEDELEFLRWQGGSRSLLYARWYPDWRLTASQNYELSASLPMYFEGDLTVGEADGAFTLGGTMRGVTDSDVGGSAARFLLINGTPGAGYVNGGVV